MSWTTKQKKKSKQWMQEHVNDTYVQQAQKEGWRSRAVFKLKEIDEKDRLLKPGMTVVDLGSTPGSWSQYAVKRIQPGGRLIALDLLAMEPLAGVDFIQGDFREDAVLEQLKSALGRPKPTSAPLWGAASRGCERGGPSESALAGRQVDLVLSDIAPNMTGIAATDSAQVMLLAELTLDFSRQHLKPGGALLVKVFQGPGFMELRKALQESFATLTSRKPAASRDRSAELYLLAKQMKVG